MTTNSQLSTTECKKQNQKQNLSKQLEQEQNQRNRDHMKGFQWGGGGGGEEWGRKVQGIRSTMGMYKIDGERLRMIKETEKSKNLHVQPMDMNQGGDAGRLGDAEWRGGKGRDIWKTIIAQSIKYNLRKS